MSPLPSKTVETGEKLSNFTVEKPDKHDLSQGIKVNISSDKPRWYYAHLMWYDEYGILPCDHLPKPITPI